VPCTALASPDSGCIWKRRIYLDAFCGIDWAEDVRHEVACCE